MLNCMKRLFAVVLTLCLLCAVVPIGQSAQAANFELNYQGYYSSEEITAQMNAMKQFLLAHKYWNGNKSKKSLMASAKKGDFSASAMGITNKGCTSTEEYCTSNSFGPDGDYWQCWGFANFVGWLLFPQNAIPNQRTGGGGWTRYAGSAVKKTTLEPGDIVRVDGHSGVVWKTEGSLLYFAQCLGTNGASAKNPSGCEIVWTYWNEKKEYDTHQEMIDYIVSKGGCVLKHPSFLEKTYEETNEPPCIAKSKKSSTASDTCRLQSEPYDADEYHLGVIEKGAVVYTKGAVKNDYENIWYIVEDASGNELGYVYSGDLEIIEPNITNKSRTECSAVAVSTTTHCYLKDRAYESSVHFSGINQDQYVNVVAKIENYHGNIWYETEDGKYVYSGDVNIFENDAVDLCKVEAQFKYNENANTHLLPYADSPKLSSVKAGQTVSVVKFVTNKYNNIWAQLSDGSYMCFYDKSLGKTHMTFQRLTNGFTETASKPTGSLKPGKAFELTGEIKANAPIYQVTAYVIEVRENGTAIDNALPPVSIKPGNFAYSANLNKPYNEVNINYSVIFNDLPVGRFRYVVTAQLGFTYEYNDKLFLLGYETAVVNSLFTVGTPGEDGPMGDIVDTPTPAPSSTYHDGVYTAQAQGFGGLVTVTVTVSDGVIVAVKADGPYETNGIGSRALNELPTDILLANGTDGVDVISGATHSSNGVIAATNKCIEQAMAGVSDSTPTPTPTPKPAPTSIPTPTPPAGCRHSNVVIDAVVYPTCTEYGWTEGSHCGDCGEVLIAQERLVAYGHIEGEKVVVTEPSATKPGSVMVCCETCGELIRMEEIPALGIARIPGDANEDGKVDIIDALLTLQYSVGWDVEINVDNANVNGDDAVNIMDALLILQYSVGWEVKLQ